MADPTQPDDAISRRYNLMKKQVKQRGTEAAQQGQDALTRQFARGGGINSGAFMKQQQIAQQKANEQQDLAFGQIDAQELGERAQLEEAQRQRDFAKSERLGSQDFASQEARTGREFQAKFQAEEAGKQRDFQRGMFDIEQKFRESQLGESIRQFEHQMAQSRDQFATGQKEIDRRFEMDKQAQDFNMWMSKAMFNKKSLTDAWLGQFGMDPRESSSGLGGFLGGANSIYTGGGGGFGFGGGGGGKGGVTGMGI